MRKNKGFTLIELLVVIAIIGILASVVLASLNSARNKSKDASIKSQMAEMRKQAAVYYSTNGMYGVAMGNDDWQACSTSVNGIFNTTGGGVGDMVLAVYKNSSSANGRVLCRIGTGGSNWAFAAPLYNPTGSNNAWCVDSAGTAKEVAVTFSQNGGAPLVSGGVARCP